ncbi:MAG: hypothetical protein M3Y89_17480 [Actinomycetota bacterium]|nr:hypothetical protein [Actinomycetota bacterium]
MERLEGQWPTLRLIHLPVHASWLDQCEIYFSIVQRKVVTPNDFTDLAQITDRLASFEAATTLSPSRSSGPSVETTSTSSWPASQPTIRPPSRRFAAYHPQRWPYPNRHDRHSDTDSTSTAISGGRSCTTWRSATGATSPTSSVSPQTTNCPCVACAT